MQLPVMCLAELRFGAEGNQTQRSTYYRVSQLQCPDWVLQLLFPDLPALLPHANLWPVPSAKDTGSWHTTGLLRNPNLLGGMGMIESCPRRFPQAAGGAPGRGLV